MKIPRVMSTQHPDNVTIPSFCKSHIMAGDDEVYEAFYAFSKLNIEEQLWDAEGKEVDNFVIKKLFSNYTNYFQKNILGQDRFITFRIPNPDVEKDEGKILLESLNSIPRNFDIGKKFYGKDIPPIFEVMIPMCFSYKNLIRVHEFYKRFIVKNQTERLFPNDITVSEWLGPIKPEDIRVTPLFETKDAILNSHKFVEKYIEFEKIKNLQRVWFARSDPALNYGSVACVLLLKMGAMNLFKLQEKKSMDIFPIMGCGSAPFRGNFTPLNADKMLKGYPSFQTFTAQSAFKYDYKEEKVRKAVDLVNNTKRKKPIMVDEDKILPIIDKIEKDYQSSIPLIIKRLNEITSFIPKRRKRKLHIDLFGYARKSGNVQLPRAITFCAGLYSLGLPPELLGLSTLTGNEIDAIKECYITLDDDMKDALQYFNKNSLKLFPKPLQTKALKVASLFEYEDNTSHNEETDKIIRALGKNDNYNIKEHIHKAGKIRQFLG